MWLETKINIEDYAKEEKKNKYENQTKLRKIMK